MDEVKNKKVILDTIDQLRGRKARPDLKGICHMLDRKHRLGSDEITRDLERLCELKIVIKQDYKGRISYRNAAKWRKSSEYGGVVGGGGAPEPDDGTAELLLRAVKELTKEARGAGCTLGQVADWMRQHSAGAAPTLQELEDALESECAGGSIQRTPSGNYCRGDRKRQRRSTGGHGAATAGAPAANAAANAAGIGGAAASATDDEARRSRAAGKRKHFRKSLGSDADSYNDGGSASAPRGATEKRCDYCLQSAEANKRGEAEELLFCKDCSAMAHPSCMNYSAQLSRRAQMSPWQCIDCKTCCICQNADDPDSMLFCDACDKGYHMSCHKPAVPDKPTGKWACHRCQEDGLEPGGQSGEASPLHGDTASGEGNSSRSSTVDSEEALKSPEQADENSTAAEDVAAPAAVTAAAPTVTTTDVPTAAKRIATTTDVPAVAKRIMSTSDVPAAKRMKSEEDVRDIEAAASSNGLPPSPQALHEVSASVSAQKATPVHSPRLDVSRTVSAPRSPPSTTKQTSPMAAAGSNGSGIGGPVALPQQLASAQQLRASPPLQQAQPPKPQISPPKHQHPVRVSPPPPPPQQKVSPLQLNSTPLMQQLAVPTPSSKLQAPLQSPRQHAPPQLLRHQAPPPPSPRQQAPPSPSARQQFPLSPRQQQLQSAASARLQQPVRSSPSRPQALALSSPVQPRQQSVMQQHDEPAKDKAAASGRYVSIPPSEWTVADVVQYFKNCGFYQESEKFMEQEIDGKSLLLLMRNDVLANMALTLGSALKIYERVKMLQACGSSKCLQQLTNGQR